MILAALVILVSIIVLYIYYDNRNHLPGPWNLPIIGYLHKLDPVSPHLTLTKLAQKYGPIFRIKLGLVNIAVVSEAKLLNKILLKDETLGRPPLFMMHVMFRGKGST
ncbi:cytochrome P450 306a1-like [Zophobas morio]|uniref:cytochrome P450 306a1-like n=1 Tax=Zophobas morio TaxID=2755281 RepID=UPI0030834443